MIRHLFGLVDKLPDTAAAQAQRLTVDS